MSILRFSGPCAVFFFFFFNDTATTEIYTLSLHDALPISVRRRARSNFSWAGSGGATTDGAAAGGTAASAVPTRRKLDEASGTPFAACGTRRYSIGEPDAFAGNTKIGRAHV